MNEVSNCTEINCTSFDNLQFPPRECELWDLGSMLLCKIFLLRNIVSCFTGYWSSYCINGTISWQVEQKPRGRGREWVTLGVHPLSWLLSNNRLEKVSFVSVPHTSSNRLLLSNQDKGCTASVAHSLAHPLGPALLNLWSDGQFQTSLFYQPPDLFYIFGDKFTVITYRYNNSLGNCIFLEREIILCCWKLIIAGNN